MQRCKLINFMGRESFSIHKRFTFTTVIQDKMKYFTV